MIRPHRWDGRALYLIDQRRLPHEEVWVPCRTAREVAGAIRDLAARGPPGTGGAARHRSAAGARAPAPPPG
ncbi:MAG: S-methyl-5-thioribose-1-phosphate isomerase, partial [Bacillota bacterium]